jgi:phosphoglycerate dehydrogenase-like enzyme
MKNIFVHDMVDPYALAKLQTMPGVRVDVMETPEEEERELPATLLADMHVLFCCLPPKNFGDLNALQLIQISSVGYSQLYGLGLVEKGIQACNAAGLFDVPIAEWNIATMGLTVHALTRSGLKRRPASRRAL